MVNVSNIRALCEVIGNVQHNFQLIIIHVQKAGIFQAYAGDNGPDQPANRDSLNNVYLHVVRLFKLCKVDQSEDAIPYQSNNADVRVKTEPFFLEQKNKFKWGSSNKEIMMYTYVIENVSLLFVDTAI